MVSVTFRSLSVDEVIAAAKRAGLDGIEWGGDIHVPHGDIKRAEETRAAMETAELTTFSYGSYYRAGQGQDFASVLDTAAALDAPNIRVWAGVRGSMDSSEQERNAVASDLAAICESSEKRGISVSVEYHGGTLTDSPESAMKLFSQVAMPNFSLYWQPNQFKSTEYNIDALTTLLPALSNIHVFAWENENKFALTKHAAQWKEYLNILRSDGKRHGLFLEFSRDGSTDAFYSDAEYLKEIAK